MPSEKLTEAITVKLTEENRLFVSNRAEHMQMESAGAYIRMLIEKDMAIAEHELRILADALGVKINAGNNENNEPIRVLSGKWRQP